MGSLALSGESCRARNGSLGRSGSRRRGSSRDQGRRLTGSDRRIDSAGLARRLLGRSSSVRGRDGACDYNIGSCSSTASRSRSRHWHGIRRSEAREVRDRLAEDRARIQGAARHVGSGRSPAASAVLGVADLAVLQIVPVDNAIIACREAVVLARGKDEVCSPDEVKQRSTDGLAHLGLDGECVFLFNYFFFLYFVINLGTEYERMAWLEQKALKE